VAGKAKKAGVLSLVELESGKVTEMTEVAGNFDVRVTQDGKRAFVFRQEGEEVVWTGIEEWDLETRKMVRKIPLKPAMASIGLKLGRDGKRLFVHEYMVQPAIVWDLEAGKFGAMVAPEGGGFERFDVTPDGRKLVGFTGVWEQGTLVPRKLSVYDIAEVTGKP
jgi:hypothetical protein